MPGGGLLRSAWSTWRTSVSALNHDMARDEAEILRTELSEELRRNAEMQQRITSLELANLETAKLVPTAAAVEADEEERQRAERATVLRWGPARRPMTNGMSVVWTCGRVGRVQYGRLPCDKPCGHFCRVRVLRV